MQTTSRTSPSKPLIGIGCDVLAGPPAACKLNLAYADSIEKAGGVPLLIPPLAGEFDEALAAVDGVLFTGGDDYDPSGYGQGIHPRTRLLPARRNSADLRLARAVARSGAPILGICGGLQLVNIALGGDLIQDIPDLVPGAVPHAPAAGGKGPRHAVRIAAGTLLERLLGKSEASVNSFHHQAAGKLGVGLRSCALAPDGVIEAIEAEGAWGPGGRFLLAVQWHPERDATEESRAIFSAFVEASSRRAGERRSR